MSPVKRIKKNKLKRTLSIDTDTALQPQGSVTAYESPDVFNEEERETLSMGIVTTERSLNGGATERELASGDTFPDLDVPMTRIGKTSSGSSGSGSGSGGGTR